MGDDEHYALGGKAGRALSMGAGFLTILTGLVNAAQIMSGWCVENDAAVAAGTETFRCIGDSLAWNTGNADSIIFDVNAPWRIIFTLRPDTFMRVWTPVLLGLVTIVAHFGVDPSVTSNLAATGWGRMSFWLVFVALFGHFGYAGNMGIVTGFMVCIAAFACMVIRFVVPGSSARMNLTAASFPDFRLPEFMGPILRVITLVLAVGAAVLTLATGLAVLYELLPDACPRGATDSCVGAGLFWVNGDMPEKSVDPVNLGIGTLGGTQVWGDLFNLAPSIFLENFTPIIFGIAGIAAQLSEDSLPALTTSWTILFAWHLFQALFANLGYGGNLGVFTGFVSVVAAFFAVLTGLTRNPPQPCRTGIDLMGRLSRLGHRAEEAISHKV